MLDIGHDAGGYLLCDAVQVAVLTQQFGLFGIGDKGYFRKNGRHLRTDKHVERRLLDPKVASLVLLAHAVDQVGLHKAGESG